jgi:hypothetical protein
MNRGGLLIRSPLDMTSRLDPTIRCLRTGGARLGGHALAPVDTRGKKANRFFPFEIDCTLFQRGSAKWGASAIYLHLTTKTAEGCSTRPYLHAHECIPHTLLASPKAADSLFLQVSSAVSRVERCGDTLPIPGRGIISMNSDIGFLQLEESKTRSG